MYATMYRKNIRECITQMQNKLQVAYLIAITHLSYLSRLVWCDYFTGD